MNCEDLTAEFCRVAGTLGDQLGALLFQLPPTLKKDLPRLDAFLDTLPPKAPAAFEFRHPSWFDDEVFARLKQRGSALCVADSEKLETPLEVTADFGYFRLRDEGYQPSDIEEWARKIDAACAALHGHLRLLQARRAGHRRRVRAAADGTSADCSRHR